MIGRRALRTALTLLLVATSSVAQTDASGSWKGSLAADDESALVEVQFERSAEGLWTGRTRHSEESEWALLEAVSITPETVRFSASSLPGAPEFVGALAADGRAIQGEVFTDPPPPLPATDIYLVEIEVGPRLWKLAPPSNVSDRDGYDNQPRFLADGSAILYTSIREDQADIYRYDISTRETSRLTATAESEYSPTPLPSGEGFSTVRVEADGTQRLWSFGLDGEQPRLLLESIAPVGYHGWLNDHLLGLFVLGDPPTLQLADAESGKSRVESHNIGRSIHLTPDGSAVSFISKASEDSWTIERLALDGGERKTIVETRAVSEDFVWAPDGSIVMGEGSSLYAFRPAAESPAWVRVADFEAVGISGITRLDVSPDFRRLVLVGERPISGPPPERIRSTFRLERALD